MDILKLNQLQKNIGYYFNDKKILLQALTHSSASIIHNERLEFLGDSILNYIIAFTLYKRFSDLSEGNMSYIRSTLVCGKTLVNIAKQFKLGNFLFLGKGEIKNKIICCESILANALEALIGSIFLDSNIQNVEKLILKWFNYKIIEISSNNKQKDPKTSLQEYLQNKHSPLPKYSVVNIIGKPHNQKFTVQCKISELINPTIGINYSIKKAEQDAAKKILNLLNINI